MRNPQIISFSLLVLIFSNSFLGSIQFFHVKGDAITDYPEYVLSQGVQIATGVHIRPSFPDYGERLEKYNSIMGKSAAVLMYFLDWSGHPFENQVFDYTLVEQVRRRIGQENLPAIMLTWQPIIYGTRDQELGDCYANNQGVISPLDIIFGKCDDYIRLFAEDLSERSERYLLRFAHEMNISDSPWWPGHFGLTPNTYVQMWRHVHTIFTQRQKELGKENVEWVWSINYGSYPNEPWNAYYNYYPGDRYVDWIGLSGYNWNNSRFPYATFSQIFGEVDGSGSMLSTGILHDLACRYAKPQIIAEIGSAGSPAQSSEWIRDAFSKIPTYPFLRGVVWFNDYAYANINSADFRVINLDPYLGEVDTRITQAYKDGISKTSFTSNLPSLSNATPPLTYCGNGEPQYIYPKVIILEPGEETRISVTGIPLPNNQLIKFVEVPDGFVIPNLEYMLVSPWDTIKVDLGISPNVLEGIYKLKFELGNVTREISVIIVQEKHQINLPVITK